ncbi:glycosyltransferase family 2 protein [Tessaracoccus antarcticus]|uniref:Glycosyltransferase family 2 protein n=1 Tax=Tessaracoccus antarcticus TaxID=2479848 RepID=A0A3M0GD93_9ACTN|nr:glycosyltransferase family 2 protein [Tessaracoccus antarcticus]RMB62278.1 glycosyltransferase family 2 protein [Tessaracoccus antarcticus]
MTEEPQEARPVDDLWAWLDPETPESDHRAIDPGTVTAVMVVHNSRAWLARQLLSLARLDPRPGRIVAVDNASTDDSPALLARAADEGVLDAVVTQSHNKGFGAAVEAGLAGAAPEWIWLLHDDSAPFPDTLGSLLDGAAQTGAAVVVPTLLQPRRRNYPETLSEAGASITRSGRRMSFVDEGDIDQQQLTPEPVLGGSTAGMLVAGHAWQELGGLAPEIPLHRDGVDLGWRANEAGHLVTTWPRAALTHRQAGRTGERVSSPPVPWHRSDRLAALRVVAARGNRPTGTLALLGGSGLRALGFLLGKSPALARAELGAARTFAATPEATTALAARTTPAPDASARVTPLLPARFWSVRDGVDRFGAGVADRYRDLVVTDSSTSIDEMTGDDFAGGQTRRRTWLSPALLVLVGLVIVGLVAGRSLLGAVGVAGGGMLPAPPSLSAAWQAYLQPDVGVGGANAPWLLLAAFFSTFVFASPEAFAVAALVLAPALAAGAALLLLRRLGLRIGAAAAGAALWAGAVLLLGIVGAGDLSGMALSITGPMLARSIHRVALDESVGAERLRSPAGVALWLLLSAAAWPVVLPLLSIAALVWMVLDRRRWGDVAIGVGLPWLFLAPWLPTLVRWPARALMGADPLAWPDFPPATFALLAGRILPSGIPPWVNMVFFAGLAVAAAAGLLAMPRQRHRMLVLAGVAVPLLAGALSSKVALATHGGQARALLSGWALLVVAALLVPVMVGLRRTGHGDAPAGRRSRAATSVLALLGVLAAGAWAWVGFQGPVGPSPSVLPGYVRDVMTSERQSRVLMLQQRPDGTLDWNAVDASQPQWGTGERNPAGAYADEFGTLVQSLGVAVVPEDLASTLTALGVSHIYMGGFSEESLASVGNAPGLTRAAVTDDAVVWTVAALPSRIRLVASQTSEPVVDGTIAPSDATRHIVLAEDDDPRWQASVGGTALQRSPDRPPVTFTVPGGAGGHLEWGMKPSWAALGWQGALAVLILVLMAPTLGSTTSARRVRE